MQYIKLFEEFLEEKRGLWANIHAKRKRGEAPAKPGDEDYPDEEGWEAAQESTNEAFVLRDLEDKYGIDLDLYDNGKFLELSRIIIPKDKRGEGIGSEIMKQINDYADSKGLKIYLTPSKDFGASSISRLEKFYKDHGFVKNTDKSETRNTMVRLPK